MTRYLADAARDLRYGIRLLRQRRGFALAAILPLALGIGAAAAMYSVVDGVMLRPLPFAEPDRLVSIWVVENEWKGGAGATRWDRVVIGQDDYRALSRDAESFAAVAAWGPTRGMLADASGAFAQTIGIRVSSSIFEVLGVRPVIGRGFTSSEDVLNGPAIALLGWEAWQQSFGGDSAIIGRSIVLDEKPRTVVGIMPAGVRLDRANPAPSFWIPAFQSSEDDPVHHNRGYRGLGRLASGTTIAQASAEAGRIITAVKVGWKGASHGTGGRATSYQDDQTAAIRPSLLILAGATALLLLIACVNLAILMLGESARRQPEIAARAALGAAPGRLVRQLLTESLVVAGGGAALGLAAGWGITRVLIGLAPGNIPGLSDVRFDLRVFAFAALCATVSGVASGVLPVAALLRWGRHPVIGAASGLTARGEVQVHRLLVGLEVALCLVMLVGCSLLGRSLLRLSSVDTGFAPDGLVLVELTGPRSLWIDSAAIVNFQEAALRELRAIPGVAMVSGAHVGPFNRNFSSSPIKVAGQPDPPVRRDVQQNVVLPDYFKTLRLPLIAGRDFNERDDQSSTRVAIISEAEAQRDFPGESPLDRRVVWQGQEWTVIGIAANVHYSVLSKEFQPTIYIPSRQWSGGWMSFLVRTASNADGALLTRAIRDRIGGVNPSIVFNGINPVPALIQRSYAEERYRALLGSLFGIVGTVLAAFGMFGVISRTVARRMREAGIRSALGAPARSLTTLMLRETAFGAVLGVVIGVPAAAWLARSLTPYLFGVKAFDPVAYLAALALFTLAAAVATIPPARRAARVDPALVLKAE